jgi:hypothetical protein
MKVNNNSGNFRDVSNCIIVNMHLIYNHLKRLRAKLVPASNIPPLSCPRP